MFGVTHKKSKPARIRSTAPSSDDDDDGDANRRAQQHQRRRKKKGKSDRKKSKTKNPPMLSFDPDEVGIDGDDGGDLARKKSKKRKKHSKQRTSNFASGGSLGYGGVGAMSMNTSEGSEEEEDTTIDVDEDKGSYYNTAAMEKLKKEQKRTTLVKDDTKVEAHSTKDMGVAAKKEQEDEAIEEQFIPLSGEGPAHATYSHAADPVVLTGDDAMAYAQREEGENDAEFDHGLHSPPTPPPPSSGTTNEEATAGKVSGMDINADDMDVDEPSKEVEDGNQKWEDTMARRAGVLPPSAAASDQKQRRSPGQRSEGKSSSLSQIRASLQPTISNLQNITSDLETSISRHQSTLSSAQDDLTKQQSTLQKHGKALEYYQGLREDLATWMGALRELNRMLEKVEEAKRQLEAEMTWRKMERFWEWGEDCTEVLEMAGLLESKVGGEDNHMARARERTIAQVDEFGRDLSSMASISRVKRWNKRAKQSARRLQDGKCDDNGDPTNPVQQIIEFSNEDNFDITEIGDWNQRHKALAQAIAMIPTSVKDDYLSISNLSSLFSNWKYTYPDDYASCYADMSLVQMMEVLVRLELIEGWDALGLHPQSSSMSCDISEFKWFLELKKRDQMERNGEANSTAGKIKLRKSILLDVVENQVAGHLLDSFLFDDENSGNLKKNSTYNPFSVTQTIRLCSIVKSLLEYFSNCQEEIGKGAYTKTTEKIFNALLLSLKHFLRKIVIPIVDASKILFKSNEFVPKDGSRGFDRETADAIAYAIIIQAKELCTLTKNILGHWYPVICQGMPQEQCMVTSLIQFVFVDIVSLRLLPILHRLHDITSVGLESDEKYSGIAKLLIDDVLDAMKGAGLLDKDEWMLMAAPMRVAASQWESNGSKS